MDKIGRNDPCPCGSDRKYKKCCLMKEEELATRHREGSAVSQALEWLSQHYQEQISEALDTEFFGAFEEDERDRMSKLSPAFQEMVHINNEWIICDAGIEVKGKRIPVRELLLGPGGPQLSAVSKGLAQEVG